jgi:hypothetical protein
LADVTAQSAMLVRAGRLATGVVPSSILTLTEGTLKAMAMTKMKIAAMALLITGVLASGAMVPAQTPGPQPPAAFPRGPGAGSRDVDPAASASRDTGLNASESDRLKAVEVKLDRVLRLLENSGSRSDLSKNAPMKSAAPELPALDNRLIPGSTAAEGGALPLGPLPSAAPDAKLAPPGNASLRFAPEHRPSNPDGEANNNLSQSSDLLARRLAKIEDRLAELERRLDRVQESGTDRAPARESGTTGRSPDMKKGARLE